MAASPDWKVYDTNGVYVAACKDAEAAACLVGNIYSGGTVRFRHNLIVWREPTDSTEGDSAAESYDGAAMKMYRARDAAMTRGFS